MEKCIKHFFHRDTKYEVTLCNFTLNVEFYVVTPRVKLALSDSQGTKLYAVQNSVAKFESTLHQFFVLKIRRWNGL